MINFLKTHLHPLGGRIIFWNLLLLVVLKLVFLQSAFQFASLVDTIPAFDSREIIQLTNQSRADNNLLPLQANVKLDLAASEKLNDMAIKEYFAHISPAGVNPWFWMKKNQYQYSVAGENLALGFFNAGDTVQAWLNSPSHRLNVLNNKYREIGVAVKAVEINGRNGILVVQMFGSPIVQATETELPIKAQTNPTVTPQKLAVALPEIVSLGQTRGESIVTQYASTDEVAKPVVEPILVEFKDTKNIQKLSETLNDVFSMYFLAFGIISAAVFMFFERNKNMALKMSLNIALFILSVIIPISQ